MYTATGIKTKDPTKNQNPPESTNEQPKVNTIKVWRKYSSPTHLQVVVKTFFDGRKLFRSAGAGESVSIERLASHDATVTLREAHGCLQLDVGNVVPCCRSWAKW